MFKLFTGSEVKRLEKKYNRLMEKARDIQRSGDLKHYARLMVEAEAMAEEIGRLKSGEKKKK